MRACIVFITLCLGAAVLAAPEGVKSVNPTTPMKSFQRIVGGEATTIEKYPFATSMLYSWWGIFTYQACGGALITSRTILSAAHCYAGDSASDWQVRVGSTFPESGGTVHAVQQLIVHASYTGSTIDYDVAIVRLSSAVTLGSTVAIASIAGDNYRVADNTLVTAIGYGTLYSGGPSADTLREVDIYTINRDLCSQRYSELSGYPTVTVRMLCAGILDVGGADACQGDSGGPLIHNGNVIVGVTSWGYGCAHHRYPGVNADVAELSPWIISNGAA